MGNMIYEVIADNSIGLHLCVLEDAPDGEVIYVSHQYEYAHGALAEDIAALMDGEDPKSWEGCSETPDEDYAEMRDQRYTVVAHGTVGNHNITVYPEKMGGTALDELEPYL